MNKYMQQGADTLRPCPKCGQIPHRVDYIFMGWDDGYAYECKVTLLRFRHESRR